MKFFRSKSCEIVGHSLSGIEEKKTVRGDGALLYRQQCTRCGEWIYMVCSITVRFSDGTCMYAASQRVERGGGKAWERA